MSLSTALRLVLAASCMVGCASVPEVETRLKNMQLPPHVYVAQPGDTLETIAFRYRIDAAELASMNPQLSNQIQAGMRVIVHQPPASSAVANSRVQPNTMPSRAPAVRNTDPALIAAVPQAVPLPQAPRRAEIVYPSSTPQGIVDYTQIHEVPANAVTPNNAAVVRAPREEVVADELDYLFPNSEPAPRIGPLATNDYQSLAESGNVNDGNAWIWPTWGEVARDFSPHETGGQGIDIAGVPGQEIHAASGGTVAYAGRDLEGGNSKLVILRHSNGLMTTYSHAAEIFVAEDDVVRAGDVIASLGANARNESVLRFEVRQDGNPLNPMNFLKN